MNRIALFAPLLLAACAAPEWHLDLDRLRQMAAEWRSDQGYGLFIFAAAGDALVGGVNLSNVRRGVAQAARSPSLWIWRP